ncbi:MAG TPA: hypothetical protein P5231_01555, partial [Ignavibacteriales bacterium]|nr:hypothetical protein [Ignavibacteriales bacterium]
VDVQVYYGPVDKQHEFNVNKVKVMKVVNPKNGGSVYTYAADIECSETGKYGYTIRILPKNEMLISQFHLGVITWS